MRQRIAILMLIMILLNGALFNRIGNRIAERAYLSALIELTMDQLGLGGEESPVKIKVTKRTVPTNQHSSQNFKHITNTDTEHLPDNVFFHTLISTELFSYRYADQISSAHKPSVFKPPA